MPLSVIHGRLGDAMLIFSLIAAAWGLASGLRKQPMSGNYWGILACAELLFTAQALIGVLLWLSGERPGRGIHLLYGAVAVLTLPAYYVIGGGRDDRRAVWIYALLCLFLAGIGLRAATTGV
jgi:hypothetical protein